MFSVMQMVRTIRPMVMINDILLSVEKRLESALQGAQPRDEDWIVLTSLVETDGSAAGDIAGKIVMSVASIQNDTSMTAYKAPKAGAGDQYAIAAAPLFLDVYVLFVSCFTAGTYQTGLGLLSRIIAYLQENPVFDEASSPDIGRQMGKLVIEYVSLDITQSSNFASLMGLKGLPFLVYRLRRLPFDGPAIAGVAPAVRRTQPDTRPMG
jgi:hypothetical protein